MNVYSNILLKGLIVLMSDDIFSKLYPSRSASEAISPFYRPDTDSPHEQEMPAEKPMQNRTKFPEETPVAMAYVPFQQWGATMTPEAAFDAGTLFPDLDKPFLGRRI